VITFRVLAYISFILCNVAIPYLLNNTIWDSYAQEDDHPSTLMKHDEFIIYDPSLKAELVASGLDYPTTMAFLGQNDILVLEKDKGTVQRIVNGTMLEKPLLDINVSGFGENGLVGIAITKTSEQNKPTYVYLYFTESESGDTTSKNKPLGNQLYRYEFVDNELINPKLLLDLPADIYGLHNGGKIIVGPKNNVYVTVGDLGGGPSNDTKAQNKKDGKEADGTGGIVRLTKEGKPVQEGIIGNKYPLNLYYAYGIRNSFGMDFDPITGNLWDTENGDVNGDEINLVEPGFNSGWNVVEGMAYLQQEFNSSKLADFNGKGKYSEPEFNWYKKNSRTQVGPTALKFIDSDNYGREYENDMLVADFTLGRIYHFDLNKDRTKLSLMGELADKMSDGDDDYFDVLFGKVPGGITDMQVGPDGYLYILSLNVEYPDCDREAPGCLVDDEIKGSIFRIIPKVNN
jgi:glucose/arabinose dehydrogenase